jgi:hypothetical protein
MACTCAPSPSTLIVLLRRLEPALLSVPCPSIGVDIRLSRRDDPDLLSAADTRRLAGSKGRRSSCGAAAGSFGDSMGT